MGLDEYRRKRRFARTSEPTGQSTGPSPKLRFVVQKHAARQLHYDLRLEWNGVLKSWAIPKGPCLDPQQKRLAIETENHPLEYLHFEGVIPKGEYGAGTMLVWDLGTWEPVEGTDWDSGELKFRLDGHKLQGRWMLVHTGRRAGQMRHWLLIKERDEAARTIRETDVLSDHPDSVLTQRSIEQMTREPAASQPQVDSPDAVPHPGRLAGARRAPFPKRPPRPLLPTATRNPPEGDDWWHEIKYDGYRMICRIVRGVVQITSRNGKDWTEKLPHAVQHLAGLSVKQATIDGEIVALAPDGRTDFQLLQNTIGQGDDRGLHYFVFDLLYLNGYDLTNTPLRDRKLALRSLVPQDHPVVHYSDHIEGTGPVVFEQACRLGAEGIVSKHADRRYASGRSDAWLKTKCLASDEFVVGGYSSAPHVQRDIRALLVGRYHDGQLLYAGRVGTGFTQRTLERLAAELPGLETHQSPFALLADQPEGRDTRWVRPQLVIEVEYAGWTTGRRLRFPTYRGLREEVDARDVIGPPPDKFHTSGCRTSEASAEGLDTPLAGPPPVRLTHPERLMYPSDGVTKLGVAAYLTRVADWILPHLVGRPLSLVRCPKGCQAKCFFQKRPTAGMRPAVEEARVNLGSQPTITAVAIHDLTGLLTLAQFSTLEIHVGGCRFDRPDRPDLVVFDLDPDESLPFVRVSEAARQLRLLLEPLGLTCFVKTTGGKGLHVVIPLRRRAPWADVRLFCEAIQRRMIAESPARYTASPVKSARRGKIYIDILRNRLGATAIAPFSTRARDGAGVALPIGWEELAAVRSADCFSIRNALTRLEHLQGDPWPSFFHPRQSLTKRILRQLD